MIQDKTCQT